MSKRNTLIRLALAAIVAVASPAMAGRVSFNPLGVPYLVPTDMSDDASIVVGSHYFGSPNFYMTQADGIVEIGGGCSSGQTTISGDGSTIAGCNVDENGLWNSAKWLGGQSWQDLGSEAGAVSCDAFLSGPWDLNQDGSKLVGLLWLAQQCRAAAGVWDLVGGGPATSLGTTVPNRATRANGIADDGTIVGWQDAENGQREAVKWVDGVQEHILTNDGLTSGEAMAVNGPGTAVVGINFGYGIVQSGWIWQQGKGMSEIAAGPFRVIPTAVSDDGRTAIGNVIVTNGGARRAFVWKEGKGLTYLEDLLKSRGGSLAAGWQIQSLNAMSADGQIIGGWGINPNGEIEGFLVDLQETGKP